MFFCNSRSYIRSNISNFKTKIPQNDSSYFVIGTHKYGKYSITVEININEEINYFNLYVIIKSFILNAELPSYAVYSSYIKKNEYVITSREKIGGWVNLDYHSFKEGLENRIKRDNEYENEFEFVCLIFLYSKSLVILKEKTDPNFRLDKIFPIYPGKKEVLNEFKSEIDEITLLKEEILYLKDKLKK